MTDFKELKKELEDNPIFAMSLTSKELFHSNFWAWLFKRNIEYVKIFFKDFEFEGDVEKDKRVWREEGHRDITIWQSVVNKKVNNAYVIENKFKSLPDKQQLERYESAIKGKNKEFCKGVITGIIEPEFVRSKSLSQWNFKSYKEIGEEIKEVAERIEKDGFEKELILKYAKMIINLHSILEGAISTTCGKLSLPKDAIEICKRIRINDILQKLKAREFVEYLDVELRKDQELKQEVKGYKLDITSDFGNSATINIFYKKGNDELKIQIENRGKEWQYRWCVGIDEKKIVGNASEKKNILNKFFEKYVQVEWFVDYKANSKRNTANYIKKIKDHISEEMLNTSQTIP